MRGKSGLALGLAIGYVFGTKAGRERYEQLSQSAKRLAADPSVQRLQTELGGLFNASKQQATTAIEGTATRAADKLEEAREQPSGGASPGATPPTTSNSTTRARTSRSSGGSRSSSSSSRSSGKSSGT
jgi:hypothetical protein